MIKRLKKCVIIALCYWVWCFCNYVVNAGRESPALHRILVEWKEVRSAGLDMKVGKGRKTIVGNGDTGVWLSPCKHNLFEWHFTITGPSDSPFEGGLYHGKVLLPPTYPLDPPEVKLLTPNGRFLVGASICLSLSNYHKEEWNPICTVTTLVTALRAHMLAPSLEIGSVRTTPSVKRFHALKSRRWQCPSCGCDHTMFLNDRFPPPDGQEDDYIDLVNQLDSPKRKTSKNWGTFNLSALSRRILGKEIICSVKLCVAFILLVFILQNICAA